MACAAATSSAEAARRTSSVLALSSIRREASGRSEELSGCGSILPLATAEATASRASLRALPALDRHGIELEPVIAQPIAELFRDEALELLDLLVMDLDHLPALDVDQVIVVLLGAIGRASCRERVCQYV